MIHYVMAHGRADAVARLAPRLGDALDATRVLGGDVTTHVAPSGCWAIASVTRPDRLSQVRLAVDGDDLAVVNGPALTVRGSQADMGRTVLDSYRQGGTATVVDTLGGTYNIAAITPDRGLRAFPDFSGIFPVYWSGLADVSIVSNRSTTVARVAGRTGWDHHALAWVLGHANLFGGRLPAPDVLYVPPGHEGRAAFGTGRLVIERGPTWGWPGADGPPAPHNLSDDEWDEVTASLVANMAALHQAESTVNLRLTGGKDSRLCLALALAAGLQDDIDSSTHGPWDSPEIEVAAAVAKAAGVPHRRVGPPKEADDGSDPGQEPEAAGDTPAPPPDPALGQLMWAKLAQDAYRYEGAVCAWSGLQNPTTPTFGVKGFGGEFYRRGNAAQFRDGVSSSLDELAERFTHYHQRHDPLGILRPEIAEHQRTWLRAWVEEAARDVRLDLLPDRFYVDHRLSHWSGPLTQNVPLRIAANPLITQSAARANMRLSLEARAAERFHYEVMRRAAPQLITVPFLNDTWKPGILADADVDLPTEPFPVTIRPQRPRSWSNPGWSMLEHEMLAMEKLFHRALNASEMPELCDVAKLKRISRRADTLTKSADIKELFSAIGVALILLGREERVVDG